ncbi:beta-propeller fold lactonase family protein, partial [Klebsiella pneumoniae]
FDLKPSHGIYELELNDDTKRLQNLRFVAAAGNPTYLALSKKNRLYAIDKVWDHNWGEEDAKLRGGIAVLDNSSRPAMA